MRLHPRRLIITSCVDTRALQDYMLSHAVYSPEEVNKVS